jgi:hypothetical protein
MKPKSSIVVLILNQITGGIQYNNSKFKGGNHPPKKSIVVRLHIKIILAYSPKKNRAKPIAEYSTL